MLVWQVDRSINELIDHQALARVSAAGCNLLEVCASCSSNTYFFSLTYSAPGDTLRHRLQISISTGAVLIFKDRLYLQKKPKNMTRAKWVE